jgi:hypothetical protein
MFRPFRALANRSVGVPKGDRVPPRVALRSTLGYLILPRWGKRSGCGSVLIEHCRRSKLWWVIRDGVCPMVLCPNGAQGIAGSLNEARWSYAPTGRKVIAQGKAKRRPGIRCARKTLALKGRNRRRVNQCAHVSPFQGFGESERRRTQVAGVPRVALRSTLGYLIMPRWGKRSGCGSVLIEHCRRSKLWWVIRDGVCPMVLCPNGAAGSRVHSTKPNGFMPQRGGRIAGSLNEAQWLYAPTGRKGIAQGKAKRRPGIRYARNNPSPERAEPAVRQSMRTCFALSGLWRIGASAYLGRWRTTQGGASLYPGLSH